MQGAPETHFSDMKHPQKKVCTTRKEFVDWKPNRSAEWIWADAGHPTDPVGYGCLVASSAATLGRFVACQQTLTVPTKTCAFYLPKHTQESYLSTFKLLTQA